MASLPIDVDRSQLDTAVQGYCAATEAVKHCETDETLENKNSTFKAALRALANYKLSLHDRRIISAIPVVPKTPQIDAYLPTSQVKRAEPIDPSSEKSRRINERLRRMEANFGPNVDTVTRRRIIFIERLLAHGSSYGQATSAADMVFAHAQQEYHQEKQQEQRKKR